MSYGRNFDFRVPPHSGQRAGRYSNGATAIAIGAPVKATGAEDSLGRLVVALATGAQAPIVGIHGVAVFEYKGSEGWAGDDPFLTTYSDKDTVPANAGVQVVSGDAVKVVFKNTAARTFLHTRAYAGRKMVAGIGQATPTVAVGDYLTPGTGDDTSGYWAETASASNAWMVVTKIDNARAEVEARLLF